MPTVEQAMAAVRVCQGLSNGYIDIHLFRYDAFRKEIYILAGETNGDTSAIRHSLPAYHPPLRFLQHNPPGYAFGIGDDEVPLTRAILAIVTRYVTGYNDNS